MRSQYLRIFWWHVVRDITRHPLLASMNILSIALGVAVYLSIQIANHSANRAFAATVDVVAGKAQLQISSSVTRLPEAILPVVAQHAGISAATPIVRGVVTLPDFPGEYLDVLGIDVFTNDAFRTFEIRDAADADFDIERWLGAPNTLAVSADFAARRSLKVGDVLRAQVNGVEQRLQIGFILRAQGSTILDSHFAAMDIGWAQELFSRRGELSSIQLRLKDLRDREKIAAELRDLVPSDAHIAAPAQRGEQVERMLAGFELNLTAMTLVSMLVGMFLIYNTVSASGVRRRSEIGILRSLGVSRGGIRALFLGEAAVLGAIGSALGLIGGLGLARLLVGTVAETISSLYVLVSVQRVIASPWMFAVAWSIGLGSVLVAAFLPASAAARMDPVQALNRGTILEQSVYVSPRWFWAGIFAIFLAIVCSCVALFTGPPWMGFGAAFFVLAGFSLIVPAATNSYSAAMTVFFRKLHRRGSRGFLEAALGAANLGRSLVRNSVTIAALAAAVAMSVGVSVMVFSFRQTVGDWVNETLSADLFILPASNEVVGPSSFLSPEAIRFCERHSSVAAIDTFREVELQVGADMVSMAVVRGSERRRMHFIHGSAGSIMPRFYNERSVLVSESYAKRHHVRDGDELPLPTPHGIEKFRIAGTFYDYTRDQGIIYMSAKIFSEHWKDDRVNSLAVYLKPDVSADEFSAEFRSKFSRNGEIAIYPNRDLRRRVFEIFDQTFAVTYVLRTIAVLVAIAGIFLTLATLVKERTRELGIFRAIGGSAPQVRGVLLWESAMIGLLAAAIGIVSGLCLSVVLTGVINRAFFGWTIQLAFPWASLAGTPLWIIGAALAAGVIPAWRASRMETAQAIRSE